MCSRQRDCQIICEADTNEIEGVKYNWPEILAGSVATITCPNNDKVNVSRNCSIEGEWLSFEKTVCGVVFEQLIKLNNTFNNVRILIALTFNVHVYTCTIIIILSSFPLFCFSSFLCYSLSSSHNTQKLTSGNYESAVSMLSQGLKQSKNNTVEQNAAVLKSTAEYLMQLSMFVNTSMVEITTAVSKLNE